MNVAGAGLAPLRIGMKFDDTSISHPRRPTLCGLGRNEESLDRRSRHASARETEALEHAAGLVERQAHDVAIRTADPGDEPCGASLDCIAAGLSLPLAASEIRVDFARLQTLELHMGGHQTSSPPAIGCDHADASDDAMPTTGQHRQAGRGGLPAVCLG